MHLVVAIQHGVCVCVCVCDMMHKLQTHVVLCDFFCPLPTFVGFKVSFFAPLSGGWGATHGTLPSHLFYWTGMTQKDIIERSPSRRTMHGYKHPHPRLKESFPTIVERTQQKSWSSKDLSPAVPNKLILITIY